MGFPGAPFQGPPGMEQENELHRLCAVTHRLRVRQSDVSSPAPHPASLTRNRQESGLGGRPGQPSAGGVPAARPCVSWANGTTGPALAESAPECRNPKRLLEDET